MKTIKFCDYEESNPQSNFLKARHPDKNVVISYYIKLLVFYSALKVIAIQLITPKSLSYKYHRKLKYFNTLINYH